MAKKIDELQEVLRKKDEDMKMMEGRYKRYVEKARTVGGVSLLSLYLPSPTYVFSSLFCLCVCLQVIQTLDPKQKPHTAPPEVQALKNQLSEKERKIQYLEVSTLLHQ